MAMELLLKKPITNIFTFENLLDHPEPGTRLFNREKSGDVCPDFLKGICQKGDFCRFRHAVIRDYVVCKHWLRGLCKKGDDCEYLHVYDLHQKCNNPGCLYLHVNPDDPVVAKRGECPWYNRGFCKIGPTCEKRHRKRKACANYMEGFCPDGPNCEFGHPKYELPAQKYARNIFRETAGSARQVTCYFCHEVGHISSNCPMKATTASSFVQPSDNSETRPDVTCFKCYQRGHYADRCPMRGQNLRPSVTVGPVITGGNADGNANTLNSGKMQR